MSRVHKNNYEKCQQYSIIQGYKAKAIMLCNPTITATILSQANTPGARSSHTKNCERMVTWRRFCQGVQLACIVASRASQWWRKMYHARKLTNPSLIAKLLQPSLLAVHKFCAASDECYGGYLYFYHCDMFTLSFM